MDHHISRINKVATTMTRKTARVSLFVRVCASGAVRGVADLDDDGENMAETVFELSRS